MPILYLLKGMALGVALTCCAISLYISIRDLFKKKPMSEPNSARDYAERWLAAWSQGWRKEVPPGLTDAVEQAILAYAQRIKDEHEQSMIDMKKIAQPAPRNGMMLTALQEYREELRQNKQYEVADRLRDIIADTGYRVQDKPS